MFQASSLYDGIRIDSPIRLAQDQRKNGSQSPISKTQRSGLPPEQGLIQLQESIRRGKNLLDLKPLPEEKFDVWSSNAFAALKAACGENSSHLHSFVGQTRYTAAPVQEQHAEAERRAELERLIQVLEAVIDEWPSSPQQVSDTNVMADTSRLTPGQKRLLLREALRKRRKTARTTVCFEAVL